jgi:glycosyltransferase involved in cell wall biosynthesis
VNICIIGDFPFPEGSASSCRVKHIALCLYEKGNDIIVITNSRLIQKRRQATVLLGYAKAIYPLFRFSRFLPRKLGFLYFFVLGPFHLIASLESVHQSTAVDAVYLYSRNALLSLLLLLHSRIRGYRTYLDVCEWYPVDHFKNKWLNLAFFFQSISSKFLAYHYDGIIAISSYIQARYKNSLLPVITVPALFDYYSTSGPEGARPAQRPSPGLHCIFRVAYSGTFKKEDRLDYLFLAVRNLSLKGIPISLDLFGIDPHSKAVRNSLTTIDIDNNLSKIVTFRGTLNSSEYLVNLCTYSVLVIPRGFSAVTKASFPNRLPEYLSTGVPVITSAVGDIPIYLSDSPPSLYLLTRYTVKALEAALYGAWMSSKDENIGPNVLLSAKSGFDYRIYSSKIHDLFSNSWRR